MGLTCARQVGNRNSCNPHDDSVGLECRWGWRGTRPRNSLARGLPAGSALGWALGSRERCVLCGRRARVRGSAAARRGAGRGSRHAERLRQGAARPRAGGGLKPGAPAALWAQPRTRPPGSHARGAGHASPPEPAHLPTLSSTFAPRPFPVLIPPTRPSHLSTHLPLAGYTPVELFTLQWHLLTNLSAKLGQPSH